MPSILPLFAALAALLDPAAHATSFVHVPFPQSVDEAPTIVRGTTGRSRADWAVGPDGSKRIFTYTDLEVRESIKGELQTGARIQLRALGGEKGGIGMQVPGTAEFTPGEDTVVFLSEKNPDGTYDVKGMAMGKYSIATDQSSGKEMLVGMGVEEVHFDGAPEDAVKKYSLADLRELAHAPAAAPPSPAASAAAVNSAAPGSGNSPLPSSPEPKSLNAAVPAPRAEASPAPADPVESNLGRAIALGLSGAALLAGVFWFVVRRSRR